MVVKIIIHEQDVKHADEALCKELGELLDMPVSTVLSGSSWIGRHSQRIL